MFVYIDGQFYLEEEAKISINDRGFLFGDGAFTTIKVQDGVPEYLDEHLKRLEGHLKELNIENNHIDRSLIFELINKNNSTYHGKINKRATREKGLDGNNFRSYVYETADNRWFDRLGLLIKKPTNLVGNNDTSEEESAIKIVKERTDNDADSVESSI